MQQNNVDEKYYVFDCDDYKNPYDLAFKINNMLEMINILNPATINIYHHYANFLSSGLLNCVFLPKDDISICFDNSDITFKPKGKVLNFKVVIEKYNNRVLCGLYIKIIDKGSKTV